MPASTFVYAWAALVLGGVVVALSSWFAASKLHDSAPANQRADAEAVFVLVLNGNISFWTD